MGTPSLLPGSTTVFDGVCTAGLRRADGSVAYIAITLDALSPDEQAMDVLALLIAMDARLAQGEPCPARVVLDSAAKDDPATRPTLQTNHPLAREAVEAVLAALRRPINP